MIVIVYYGLPNMQSRLTHEVLEFLPAAVGRNLRFQSDHDWKCLGQKVQVLTPWRKTTNSSSDLRDLGRPFSRPRNGIAAGKYLNLSSNDALG